MNLQRCKVAVFPLLAAVVALTAADSTLPPDELWDELNSELLTVEMTEPTAVIDDWVTEDWYTARDKLNPRCPTLDPHIPGFCADLCGEDWYCSEGKVCCRNNCGGTECMDPVSEGISAIDETPTTTEPPQEMQTTEMAMTEPTEVMDDWVTEAWFIARDKPNPRCPTLDPNIPSPCADMCVGDRSCPDDKVCCRNNCGGSECMDPVSEEISATDETLTTIEPSKELQVEDTEVPQTTQIKGQWISDYFDWIGGRTKMSHRCPSLSPFTKDVCDFTCGFCYDGKVCCLNNCGGTECMEPVNKEESAGNEKEKFFWDLYAKNTIHQYQKVNENEV